jgi:3-isopropylmalate/(R)-2-methylmalate dehydratase small subunit
MTARPSITRFEGPAIALPRDNVDTDQIIPARFLKTTSRTGLGAHLFADWRFDAAGVPRADFVLNAAEAAGAAVLVAGVNFGCGSSREHAPWALVDFGFRAVIAGSFADIFRQNSLKNGLLPIQLPPEAHRRALECAQSGGCRVFVDLVAEVVSFGGETVPFAIDPFARECLMAGVDEIGYVLRQEAAIAHFEAARAAARP